MAMQLPAGSGLPISSEELAVFTAAPKELPFLNVHRFLHRVGVRVPKICGQWAADGLLLLEDLGDTALWDRVQGLSESEVIGWYKKAIDELLLLQIAGTENRDEACIAFQQRFDAKTLQVGIRPFYRMGTGKTAWGKDRGHYDCDPAANIRCHRADFGSPTRCLNHRDYHSWNLMIHDEAVASSIFKTPCCAAAIRSRLAAKRSDHRSVVRPHMEPSWSSTIAKEPTSYRAATCHGRNFWKSTACRRSSAT